MGDVFIKKKKYKEASELYNNALKINLKLKDVIYTAETYNNLGITYFHLGVAQKSKDAFQSALRIALQVRSKMEVQNAYNGLMLLAEKEADYKEAFIYSRKVKVYADSIVNEKNTQYIREVEAIYNKDKEQQKIKLLEVKQNFTRWLAIAGFGLFFLIFVLGGLIYIRNKLIKKNELLKHELYLRSEIAKDLHDDMGSILSSISILNDIAQREVHNNENLDNLLSKMMTNIKYAQEATDDIIWAVNPLNDKLLNLDLRIKEYVIPLFETKKIDFKIITPPELNNINLSMDIRRNIYLIIKEAVNNSLKYSECTKIDIEFYLSKSILTIIIRDNGAGFDTTQATKRNGLRNMKCRAEQIGAKLDIVSKTTKGTTISLETKII